MAVLNPAARALLLPLLAIALASPLHAAESLQLVEQQIKAGFLYNFLKSTAWPADTTARTDAPIIVCLLGGDPFSGHLRPMAGRTVNQRVIEIRNVRVVEQTQPCSLLFVHASEKPRWPQLRAAVSAKPLLTVSDFEGFAESGGMIEFTRIDRRIGLKLNNDAVTAAKLQVEDRLLKLATPVRAAVDAR